MKAPLHATCIAIEEHGVLLRGPSGCGKSDLALRLIEAGASLVGDDYCLYDTREGRLFALPHPEIAGLLEVRGLGLVRFEHRGPVPLALLIDLVPRERVPRLAEQEQETLFGVSMPRVRLHAFDVSTPAKIRLALRHASENIILPP